MNRVKGLARRHLLQAAGVAAATVLLPSSRLFAAAGDAGITSQLARYIANARHTPLPSPVTIACKQHILDTFGAMVSGAQLRPGEMARGYIKAQGGTAQATVLGAGFKTTAVNAALANAMCAHADETDDFEPVTKAHPGCSVIPAALAMAEWQNADGEAFIRAVALGYDVACRLLLALGPDLVRGGHRSAEGTAATFGAVAAAASLAQLDETTTRYALSYAAQQESGLWSWVKDQDHIEKAFDFAGMGARNGVQAVTMVMSGMTGVSDVLDGTHNLFIALSPQPQPQQMVAGLGERWFVTETAIKTYSVGYPIQAPLDAMLLLRKAHGLTPAQVKSIEVRVPSDAVGIVGDSAMPDVNCAHMVAVALLKGRVSFADSHDLALMKDPGIVAARAKIKVVADNALDDPAAPRAAKVTATLNDGSTVGHYTRFPSGTKENPLTAEQVNAKVRDLITPVMGEPVGEQLIEAVNTLGAQTTMREVVRLMAGASGTVG